MTKRSQDKQEQFDPDRLKVPMVEYWHRGTKVTDMMPLREARQRVEERRAYVINGRAIGLCFKGQLEG